MREHKVVIGNFNHDYVTNSGTYSFSQSGEGDIRIKFPGNFEILGVQLTAIGRRIRLDAFRIRGSVVEFYCPHGVDIRIDYNGIIEHANIEKHCRTIGATENISINTYDISSSVKFIFKNTENACLQGLDVRLFSSKGFMRHVEPEIYLIDGALVISYSNLPCDLYNLELSQSTHQKDTQFWLTPTVGVSKNSLVREALSAGFSLKRLDPDDTRYGLRDYVFDFAKRTYNLLSNDDE